MLLEKLVPAAADVDANVDFDLAPYTVSGATVRIPVGEVVETTEPPMLIGGVERPFTVRYRFYDTRLSSIQFRSTNTAEIEGRQDFSATIISKRDLQVLIDQKWWSLEDLQLAMFKQNFPSLKNKIDDELKALLAGYGIDPGGELTMYIQQLGADRDRYDAIAAQFQELGAVENSGSIRSPQNKSHVVSSYRHPGGSSPVRVDYMEISYADRSRSRAVIPTGFIGFFEASYNQFNTVVALHKERAVLKADGSDEARVREQEINRLFGSMVPRRPFHNWGGLSVAMSNDLTDEVAYYPQQVPCGRLGVRDGDTVLDWDVWSNNTLNAPVVAPSEETTTAADEESVANLLNQG
jgi:hypothetical protein